MMNTKTTLLAGCAVLLTSAPAMAQQQAPSPTDAQASGSTTGTAATQPDYGQDIVVTANRREQSVLNVPAQITALTGNDLAKRNTRSLDEFVGFVPGLSVQSATPGANLIVVRGVTTGSQATNAVGAYFDDVPVNSSNGFAGGYRQLSLNVFDLDRVEVLSGPQGTLYGASSLGGTIRYITAKPQLDRGAARLEGEVSTTDNGGINTGGRGMINIPLVPDRLALRADFVQQYDSGFADNPRLGRNNQGSGAVIAARASLLAQITPDLNVQITGFTQTVRNNGVNTVDRNPVTGGLVAGEGFYQQSYQIAQPIEQTAKIAYGTVNWDAGFAKLTSITSFQHAQFNGVADLSRAYSGLFSTVVGLGAAGVNRYRNNTSISLDKFTQEGRLVSKPGRIFDWVVGVYYTNERALTFTNVLNDSNPAGTLLGFPIIVATIPTVYREIAGYANGTLHLGSKFDLTLGYRRSHNDQSFTETLSGLFGNASNPNANRTIGAPSSEDVNTYLINPSFRLNHALTLYARVANGFRPGGPNYALPGSTQVPRYDADRLWTYEIGAKTALLNNRLQASLSVYDTEWSKIQLTTVISGLSQLTNAGDARIRGGEFAFGFRPTRALTLNGSLSYTDAKLTTTSPAIGIAFVGARLPVSPRWAFALGADYAVTLGNGQQARLSVTDRYQGTRYSGIVGSTSLLPYRLDAYNLVDADLSVGLTDNIEIGVYAKNIFNSHGEVFGGRADNLYAPAAPAAVTLTRPRTLGVQGRLKL